MLTDLDMPRLDGVGLIRRIRSKPQWQRLPVLVLSTRGSAEDKKLALDAGADGYLVKTEFNEATLREAVARRLGEAPSGS